MTEQNGTTNIQVGIIMGSDSDLTIMKEAASILQHFEVEFELTVVSAHRTPCARRRALRTGR